MNSPPVLFKSITPYFNPTYLLSSQISWKLSYLVSTEVIGFRVAALRCLWQMLRSLLLRGDSTAWAYRHTSSIRLCRSLLGGAKFFFYTLNSIQNSKRNGPPYSQVPFHLLQPNLFSTCSILQSSMCGHNFQHTRPQAGIVGNPAVVQLNRKTKFPMS